MRTAVFYGTQSWRSIRLPGHLLHDFRRWWEEKDRHGTGESIGKKIMGMAIPVSTPYTLKAVVVS